MQVVIQQMVINYLLLLFLNIIAAFTVRALEPEIQSLKLTSVLERSSEMALVQRRKELFHLTSEPYI